MVIRRILSLSLLLSLLVLGGNITPVAHAQGGITDIIDRAMSDLSTQLGRTITRDNAIWSWSENVYNDTSLGCPAEGEVYSQVQTRAYSIDIQTGGIVYNYRVTADGNIFFQCSAIPVDEVNNILTQELGTGQWWAWLYDTADQMLYLVNDTGEKSQFARPLLPDEIRSGGDSVPRVVPSRDSRYFVITSQLINGNEAVGIYDVATGTFVQVHEAQPNEDIQIGFMSGGSNAGSPYIFDSSLNYVAIAYSNLDLNLVGNSTWRIVVYELATGNPVYQLDNTNPNLPAFEDFDTADVFPRILYYGDDVVHIQLIYAFAEGMETYPTVAWHPNANLIEESAFTGGDMDVSVVDERVIFPYLDSAFTSIEQFAPISPYNAIGADDITAPTQLWVDGTAFHTSPRWTSSNRQVLYQRHDGTTFDRNWSVLTVDSKAAARLDAGIEQVGSLPSGFLSLSASSSLAFHSEATPLTGTPVWQAPNTSPFLLLWSSMPNVPFGLTSLTIPVELGVPQAPVATTAPPAVEGSVLCAGTPPSRMAVGVSGRVTVTDGTTTRLRSAPGGDIIYLMPELTPFTVIGGPQCQGEFTWWQVQLTDRAENGWVAEGSLELYFIEPADASQG